MGWYVFCSSNIYSTLRNIFTKDRKRLTHHADGGLAHAHARPSAQPPIYVSGSFLANISA